MKPFITFTKERYKLYRNYFFFTLSDFIYKLHQKYFHLKEISSYETEAILAYIIQTLSLQHFDYLDENSKSLKDLVSFLISVKRNELHIDDFEFESTKKSELKKILYAYNDFLNRHNLADLGDIEKNVYNLTKEKKIVIIADQFENDNIHFFTSRLQKKIFDNLDKEFADIKIEPSLQNHYLVPSFNSFDEVKNALKIVRDLIENGENIEDIKIVASDIDEYYPLFKALFDEYGLIGYSTKGEKLKDLICINNQIAKAKYEALKTEAAQLKKRLEHYGIKRKNILKDLLEDRRVLIKNNGIEITETNQIYVYSNIKHLIFVGADITHFPPKREKNIFYVKDYETKFFANSLYRSAIDIYEHMKRISTNLYVLYSQYQGKTKRVLSFIIDKNLPTYRAKTKADIEQIKENKRVTIECMENFLKDLDSQQLDEYNGKNVGNFQVNALSASRINEYLKCPRIYFYKNILHLKAPIEESKEMEVTVQGMIMHKAFEAIVNYIKNEKCDIQEIKDLKKDFAQKAYQEILAQEELEENIYTKLYFQKLLDILDNFIIYLVEDWKDKNRYKNSYMEEHFYLDEKLKISDEKNYFIKGVIDRIDVNDEVEIFDYKSKKTDKLDYDKIEEIIEIKDVQLGLYTYWVKQKYQKSVTSSLITFNTNNIYVKFATLRECDAPKISRGKSQFACYNDEYEKRLKETIFNTKQNIENGNFVYNDSNEDVCKWCDYEVMCKRY
ncbi:PD-(D/E)XK nuclease family protein [Nitratiruptor tergarcus]|uniref:PD-(D/E)XK nuclease superfamily protein n=1 Tax=Nitratiruptor tergarcus DSM 16512 TaxID=1069081 RepID=A0A1W1WQ23_9BACT|nr:PD-(D/E)XK nuclease family protein [Nitratiruptor tergarcus]SMC08414.1 PD-(D/E)XK nuclease superfamily protein [Nitratiruptor tergarcus DSM 16512]